LVIDYVPKAWLIESKSLKFFLAYFRSHSSLQEGCTIEIGKRITAVLDPAYLRIGGYWYPRGGMPIEVSWATGTLPDGVWLPDQYIAPYCGRGWGRDIKRLANTMAPRTPATSLRPHRRSAMRHRMAAYILIGRSLGICDSRSRQLSASRSAQFNQQCGNLLVMASRS
jgi:hypothetical protein